MKFLLPIIIIIVLISGYFVISKNGAINILPKPSQVQSPSSTPQLKTFKSSNTMKFTINVPSDATTEENLGIVTIITRQGKIYIGRNGTNYNNLTDYIKNSGNNLDKNIMSRKEMTINSLESVSGDINDERDYFIYANNIVYILYTKDKNLYSTLDQVAQSFRYTP